MPVMHTAIPYTSSTADQAVNTVLVQLGAARHLTRPLTLLTVDLFLEVRDEILCVRSPPSLPLLLVSQISRKETKSERASIIFCCLVPQKPCTVYSKLCAVLKISSAQKTSEGVRDNVIRVRCGVSLKNLQFFELFSERIQMRIQKAVSIVIPKSER